MTRRIGGREVDFNELFTALNGILIAGTLAFYGSVEFPPLVNGSTLILYSFLAVEIQLFLLYERRHRSPFILFLAFVLILFHFPRILTLYWNDVYYDNRVLLRLRPTTVPDVNNTLLFMFFANMAIFIGICCAQLTVKERTIGRVGRREVKIKTVLVLLGLALVYQFYTSFVTVLLMGVEERGLRYLGLLADPSALILIGLIFFLADSAWREKTMTASQRGGQSGYALLLAIGITSFVALKLVIGSRSAVLSIVQIMFITLLALGRFKISTKAVVITGLAIALSIPAFVFATLSRSMRVAQGTDISLVKQREELLSAVPSALNGDMIRILIPVFARTAYLDYTIDLMKNSREYKEVINIPLFFESVVDNVTPGFDVFDMPKAANALSHVYDGAPLVRVGDSYNSDQFNNYGEYYVLFGAWLAMPAFFVVAFIFQAVYLRVRCKSALASVVWKFFVITLYFSWLISFGTDWFFLEATRGFLMWFVVLAVVDRRRTFSLSGWGRSNARVASTA